VSVQALDSPRRVARDIGRLPRVKRPCTGGCQRIGCSPLAVHCTIPVDFTMLTEGLGLLEDPMARLEEQWA
jgi:hypothetical protein